MDRTVSEEVFSGLNIKPLPPVRVGASLATLNTVNNSSTVCIAGVKSVLFPWPPSVSDPNPISELLPRLPSVFVSGSVSILLFIESFSIFFRVISLSLILMINWLFSSSFFIEIISEKEFRFNWSVSEPSPPSIKSFPDV